MSLVQKLELRQGQSLLMTPQLVQAIKLLQMPQHDLQAFIDDEIENNPLLERAETEEGSPEVPDGPENDLSSDILPQSAGPAGEPDAGEWFFSERQPGQSDFEQTFDAPMDNVFPDDNTGGFAAGSWNGTDDDLPEIGQTLSAQITLQEHLLRQLEIATADPKHRLIGNHLIDAVDGNGYLSLPLDEIAAQLGIPCDEAEAVLALVHGFEPTGVGARSLKECLALQLRERNRLTRPMECMLSRLDLVARRDLAALRKLCGVDSADIGEMVKEIRRLDPRPGSAFGSEPVELLLADVIVRRLPDGSWQVELNPETMPRVLVNQDYHATLAGPDGRTFVNECLARANWLVRSLEQRSRTILRIAAEIVRRQEGFFLHGVSHLKPLTLRQVAEAVEVHESTVSRATANKSFGTDRGIFDMKFFFSAAIARGDGAESQAAEVIRQRIKHLIEQENPDDILSDDALVQRLKLENMDVARRTVAKYRESLRIPSSPERRRLKKEMA